MSGVQLRFAGELWYWRGPAPYHFVTVPEREAADIAAVARSVSYGWGVVPVAAEVGRTAWTTSLFPKDGGYLLPVKDRVRRAEGLELGDVVTVALCVGKAPAARSWRASGTHAATDATRILANTFGRPMTSIFHAQPSNIANI